MEDQTPKSTTQRSEPLGLSHLTVNREIAERAIDGSGIPYLDNGHFRGEMAQLRAALDAALAEIADLRTAAPPPPPLGNLNTLESGLLEADSARLRAQVLEARNADLTAALDAAMTEMANFVAERSAMDSQRREIAALRDQLATAQLALESHNESMDEFAATRLELDLLREDHQRHVFNLQAKLDSTEAALKRAQIESESLAGERDEAASLRTRLDQADLERTRLSGEIARLNAAHTAAQGEIDNVRVLAADIPRLRNSLQSAKAALEQAANSNDANEAEIARLQVELRETNSALLSAVAARENANAAGERLQTELAAMRNALQFRLDANNDLQAQLSELSLRHDEAVATQQRLQSIEEEFHILQNETEQLRAELASQNQVQSESNQTIALLRNNLDSLREEHDALRSLADELPQVTAARDHALADLEQSISAKTRVDEECEQLRAQVAELAAVNHELHTTRKQLKSDAEMHQQSLAATMAQLEKTVNERDAMNTRLRTEQDNTAQLDAQLTAARSTIGEREREIEKLQQELNQLAAKEQELLAERSESSRLRGHLNTLALMSADAEVGSARLRRQQRNLQRRLESTRDSLAGAVARGAALEETDATLKLREEELQAARDSLLEVTARNEQLLNQLADAAQNDQKLREELADARERAGRRNAHAETLQAQMEASAAEARGRIEKLRTEIEQISASLRQYENDAANYKQQAEAATTHVSEVDSRLRQSEDANGELNRKVAELDELLRKRERELAEMNAELAAAKSHADEHGRLRLQLDAAHRKAEELHRSSEESDSLRSDLARMSALADRQQTELDSLRQQLADADAARSPITPMQEELARLHAELTAAREQATRAEETSNQQREQIAESQRRLAETEAEIARVKKSASGSDSNETKRLKARMQAQTENRQRQLEELAAVRRSLAEADAQRRQLQAELEALKLRR